MTNLHKIALMVTIAVMLSMAINAQEKGDMAAGVNLVLGTGSNSGVNYTNIGIGMNFLYNVTNPFRMEASFTYFFEKDFVSMWDFSLNGHYLLTITDQVTVYPLAGLGVLGAKKDYGLGSNSDTYVCVNLGGGVDFKLTDQFVFNAGLKYKIVNEWNRLMLSAGILYRF